MSTPEPEFRRGTGPDALPQGEAQNLNDAMAEVPAQQEQGATAPTPEDSGVELAQPSDYEPIYEPETDDDLFLTGPTTRPDEPVTTGIPTGAAGVPADVIRNLPLLQRAAQEPGADPKLQTLVALVLRELEGQ
jgi:hypothetical protein